MFLKSSAPLFPPSLFILFLLCCSNEPRFVSPTGPRSESFPFPQFQAFHMYLGPFDALSSSWPRGGHRERSLSVQLGCGATHRIPPVALVTQGVCVCVRTAITILGMAGGGGVIRLEKAEGYKSLTRAPWPFSSQTIYNVNMN